MAITKSVWDQLPQNVIEKIDKGELHVSTFEAAAFVTQMDRIQYEFDHDDIIFRNPFTKWAKLGRMNTAQVIDWVIQFSIFSVWFVVAECMRMAWAIGTPSERPSRILLASEIGVQIDPKTHDVEDQVFRHADAHINWLRLMLDPLGVDPSRVGRRSEAHESTNRFVDYGLLDAHGGPDIIKGAGANFWTENWAGRFIGTPEEENNFWVELKTGMDAYNRNERIEKGGLTPLPLGFLHAHIMLERAHVATVDDELAELFFDPSFDLDRWWKGFYQSRDSFRIFWNGLDKARKALE